MSKRKQLLLMMFFASNYLCLTGVFAVEPVDKDNTPTKHYYFPFGHVDIARNKDGSHDVDVKAPFTAVHNPAGADNAQVKAPFYKEDHGKDGAVKNEKAPLTAVQKSTDKKQQK